MTAGPHRHVFVEAGGRHQCRFCGESRGLLWPTVVCVAVMLVSFGLLFVFAFLG